jgi:hypothetical protein
MPPVPRVCRSLRKQFGRNILSFHLLAFRSVSSLVVEDHPQAKKNRNHKTNCAKNSGRDQSWKIFRSVFSLEDIGPVKSISSIKIMREANKIQIWYTYATRPITLATGTATLVSITRLFSLAMLLLYHVSNSTDGADVPHVIMKHA